MAVLHGTHTHMNSMIRSVDSSFPQPQRTPVVMFDLGGVLYHIALQRTKDCFSLLANKDVDFSLRSQHEVFDRFECGTIDEDEFRSQLRLAYSMEASDEDINAAWNALLVGLDPRALGWLRRVKEHFRVVLLSNINSIHYHRIKDECAELFTEFEHLFLSFEIGQRKPWPAIYRHVLDSMQLPASSIFYLDDSPQHIATATEMGFACVQVPSIDAVPGLLWPEL